MDVILYVLLQDPRFDDEVDKITGYHTDSLLCMSVKNAFDEIIAVAQVVNKNPDNDVGHFTEKDEKVSSIHSFQLRVGSRTFIHLSIYTYTLSRLPYLGDWKNKAVW